MGLGTKGQQGRSVRQALTGVMSHIPRGKAGQALRFRLIKWLKLAPLPLAIALGDTAVLVGAVGDGEVWRMARLVGEKGRVVVVEPAPDNVRAIEERLRKTGVENVTVIAKGAWSAPGKQTLYVHPRWSASNIILDSGAAHDRAMSPADYSEAIEIEVDRLDDILSGSGIEDCDFIKITVMGAEMHVLKGMERLLSGRSTLWVKGHSTIDGHPANAVIANMLGERGFRTVVVRGNRGPDGTPRPGDVYAMKASYG